MTRQEWWYERKLQRYFDRYWIEFGDDAEFYVNPAPNKWKFLIRELGLSVELTCNDIGIIREKRYLIQ